MESLGTGVQRGFSPSCPRSQRFHRWSPKNGKKSLAGGKLGSFYLFTSLPLNV